MGQHQLGEMGLSETIGAQMGEQGVAVGSVHDLLLMQGDLDATAMGQAAVGSPSPSPAAWPRQSPEPCSPSGCLKAGPWARVPVLHWGGGACCSLGCMGAPVHALPSALGCQQDQTQPELGEDATPWLSHRLFLGLHPTLPPCRVPRGGSPGSRYLTSRLKNRVRPCHFLTLWAPGSLQCTPA